MLYNLKFEEGIGKFHAYQQARPQEPLGFAAEAAALAFREFHRLELLMSRNFLGSRPLFDRPSERVNAAARVRLDVLMERIERLAEQRLKQDSGDQDAMFALSLSHGLNADYAYLVEKRPLASLKSARTAEAWAHRVLAANSQYYDAHLPPGAANYILANLPLHQRLALRIGGIAGDRKRGLAQLQRVAAHGNLMKPFARILLAMIAVREKEVSRARELLSALREEFPGNTIFPMELALLDKGLSGEGN